jgi:hypothetical protein
VAATLFDVASERLEAGAEMERLAARGTLRLALKQAGLDTQNLTIQQLRAVFEKLMPKDLEARGVSDAEATCRAIMAQIAASADLNEIASPTLPDDVFKRLGGN